MELINQHTKEIMEGCKARARDAGLRFEDETLEYIVTNRDLLELSPKMMIPTLYDYWVHDVEVMKEKGKYELYPHNPYETVINTRPAISFYNDNNPDWLNVMIFYHVLGHIDFFQNNIFFRHTWNYDFAGQALSDKRTIAKLRAEKGRWVDYMIEFARGMDNLVGYHIELYRNEPVGNGTGSARLDYYFDVFLQKEKKVKTSDYIKEVERYNASMKEHSDLGERQFFTEIDRSHPEFAAFFEKYQKAREDNRIDPLQYLMKHSTKLAREENRWILSVIEIVRQTSLFFQPQIRTKIMNEGWASYWHETLFLQDDRIEGHEADFARVNAGVTAMPRVGLNPYALGMRLFYHLKEYADKGRYSIEFQDLQDTHERKRYDTHADRGNDFIFHLRENYADFSFINNFIDQDFMDRHKLFVAGRRLNKSRMVWEYYVKSRKVRDYRQMLIDLLYHPPRVEIDPEKSEDGVLYLKHRFEEKPLVKDFIANTLMGIEFLWGGPVMLETSEPTTGGKPASKVFVVGTATAPRPERAQINWQRVVYTMKDRKLSRKPVD